MDNNRPLNSKRGERKIIERKKTKKKSKKKKKVIKKTSE